ncbi:hypothetical protein [Acinetobacter johnsonii]|jgi:hypothetical protein|uniref:hypothetical protein n=1 Tax=Acinetobacter TaxID=469 RepID=UPI003AF97DAC
MATGIEINRGGNNKISGGSINLKDSESKGIVLNDTYGNKIKDIEIIIENANKKFEEIKTVISSISDNSINPKTNNTFKADILSKIPNLMNVKDESSLQLLAINVISLLSNWITIKTELTIKLAPYIDYLTTLMGG